MIKAILAGAIFGVTVGIFYAVLGLAVDNHFEQQDLMLCRSAKVSRNEIYLNKCVCYYAGENIRCIYKGGR